MSGDAREKKYKKAKRTIGVTGVVYLSFRFLLPLFWPFLLACMVGAALNPAVEWGRRRLRLPGGLVSLGVVTGALLLVGGLVFGLLFVLAGQVRGWLEELPAYWERAEQWLAGSCGRWERMLHLSEGSLVRRAAELMEQAGAQLQEQGVRYVVDLSVPVLAELLDLFAALAVFLMGAVLAARDWKRWREVLRRSLFGPEWERACLRLKQVGRAYIRSEMRIFVGVALVSGAGLWIIGSDYVLLGALAIAVVDVLPIFGAGVIYVPWAVLSFFQGRFFRGSVLLAAGVVCYFLRNSVEAKQMGKGLGFPSVVTLLAAYVGWRLFGLAGFLLGPVGLILVDEFI